MAFAATTTPLPRPEAVIYRLGLAAHDFALKLCEDVRSLSEGDRRQRVKRDGGRR